MSEFTCATTGHRSIRYNLLATASLSALLAVLYLPAAAKAEADDRPTVWIELGGQMEHITGQGDAFVPGFLWFIPKSSVLQSTTPVQAQKPIPFNFGWDGKISVEPQGSNWKFSVSVKYGRSANSKNVDHQTKGLHKAKYKSGMPVPERAIFLASGLCEHEVGASARPLGYGLPSRQGCGLRAIRQRRGIIIQSRCAFRAVYLPRDL